MNFTQRKVKQEMNQETKSFEELERMTPSEYIAYRSGNKNIDKLSVEEASQLSTKDYIRCRKEGLI